MVNFQTIRRLGFTLLSHLKRWVGWIGLRRWWWRMWGGWVEEVVEEEVGG